MHFALLFGYGASIINPYMSFAVIDTLVSSRAIQLDIRKLKRTISMPSTREYLR
jgi:glutamate synthase (NADPH/NADH) large chain